MRSYTRGSIDVEALRRDIRRKMDGPPRTSYRTAAREIAACNDGSGPMWNSLAQVVSNGRVPDADHYLQICKWLGVPLEKYTGRATPELVGLDYIDALLLQDPKLERSQAVALSDMIRAAYKVVARKEEHLVK
jgi:hypothetical protein